MEHIARLTDYFIYYIMIMICDDTLHRYRFPCPLAFAWIYKVFPRSGQFMESFTQRRKLIANKKDNSKNVIFMRTGQVGTTEIENVSRMMKYNNSNLNFHGKIYFTPQLCHNTNLCILV